MADNSQPKLIRPQLPPVIECPVCGIRREIRPDETRVPNHEKPDSPKQKCLGSGRRGRIFL
jgi:hypothetical protein